MAEIINLDSEKVRQDDDFAFKLFEEISPAFHEGHDPVSVCLSLWITLSYCLFIHGDYKPKELNEMLKWHYKNSKKD